MLKERMVIMTKIKVPKKGKGRGRIYLGEGVLVDCYAKHYEQGVEKEYPAFGRVHWSLEDCSYHYDKKSSTLTVSSDKSFLESIQPSFKDTSGGVELEASMIIFCENLDTHILHVA